MNKRQAKVMALAHASQIVRQSAGDNAQSVGEELDLSSADISRLEDAMTKIADELKAWHKYEKLIEEGRRRRKK